MSCVARYCETLLGYLFNFRHREELEERLHNITMERSSVSENMQWCIEHSESALEVSWLSHPCIVE